MFGSEPNVNEHIKEIQKKFRGRFWALIHLRNAGFSGDQIVDHLRPIIEYCSVIYHPLLTVSQSEQIERMQKQALRLAYGWDRSYEQLCAEKNITTLQHRRESYIDRFTEKTLLSERFGHWYPEREETEHLIRNRRNFEETRSRTRRYYNSPLSFLRRRANDLFQTH